MRPKPAISERAVLGILLGTIGVILFCTVIEGLFIVDEANYMVTVTGLRNGQLSVPGTEGVEPSIELMYFCPSAKLRTIDSTPVTSTAPPLYSFFAYPFSFLGWRGLVLLNIISFMACGAMIFYYTRKLSNNIATAWSALII